MILKNRRLFRGGWLKRLPVMLLPVAMVPVMLVGACQSDNSSTRSSARANTPSPARTDTLARPALWQVSDEDTTIYLFGTVHMLPAGVEWLTPALAGRIDSADTLVLEVVLDQDDTSAADTMRRLGLNSALPPLVDRVPPTMRPKLLKVVADSHLPMAMLDGMDSWAAAVTLGVTLLVNAGASPDNGVETVLTNRFRAVGKPIGQLETVDQQLGYFDTLPESAQIDLLKTTIEDTDILKSFNDMAHAWEKGDTPLMAKTFDEFGKYPKLQDALITQRNRNWAAWIRQRLARPGTIFIAVGTGHLVGKGSVQDQLARLGVKAARVQ